MARRIGVGKLAGAFVGLNMLDCGLTTYMIGKGGTELNPLMNSVIQDSLPRFWLIKIVGSISAVALLLVLERALVLLTILMIAIVAFNLVGMMI